MHERAFLKSEEGLAVVAVLILLDGVLDGLAGEGVLQLGGGGGDAVDTKQEIDGL
jgi:hypothetical protein